VRQAVRRAVHEQRREDGVRQRRARRGQESEQAGGRDQQGVLHELYKIAIGK
jgi:hypothetical protein